jgi:hypothetical protein
MKSRVDVVERAYVGVKQLHLELHLVFAPQTSFLGLGARVLVDCGYTARQHGARVHTRGSK